jgi:ribonucleotide monophosphatase NagD (HAD superfamily)
MGRYLAFQLGTGRAGGKTVALPESLRLMQRQEIAISKASDPSFSGYGLGWFTSEYRGVKVVEHGGNINGFTAAMQLLPEKRLGFVLLTNQNAASEFTQTTSRGLTELLLNMQPRSDFADSGYSATRVLIEQTKTHKPSLEQYKAHEGNYALISGDRLRVYVENGKLFAQQGGQIFELKAASSSQYVVDVGGFILAIEFQTDANGLVWLYQEGTVVGVRLPATTATASANTAFKDPQARFNVVLPAELQIVQSQPILIAQTAQAAFVFLNGAAKATLEQSAQALLQQIEPSFNLKPIQVNTLPAINGIVWTQQLYALPQEQILALLITQRGNQVYAIAVQAEAKNINSTAPILQQLLSSYQIL